MIWPPFTPPSGPISIIQSAVFITSRLCSITFVVQGNTVVVIEHNLDVIKTADWIIDMGPNGGINGGQIIAEGNPEKISEISTSYTGSFLKNIINFKFKKTA